MPTPARRACAAGTSSYAGLVSIRTRIRSLAAVSVGVIAVARFMAIDAGSHSASDTLRPWFIQVAMLVAVALVVVWLVERFLPGAARR